MPTRMARAGRSNLIKEVTVNAWHYPVGRKQGALRDNVTKAVLSRWRQIIRLRRYYQALAG